VDGQRILKLVAGTPCAGPHIRRRNFFTTGNGSRRRGNPEPLAKGETPEPPARGKPRATRQRATPSLWRGETLSHPATGETPEPPRQWDDLGPFGPGKFPRPRQRDTSGPSGLGEPGATRHGESSGHWSGENPGQATGHPGPIWVQGPGATGAGSLRTTGLEKTPSHGKGVPRAHWAWRNPGATGEGKPCATGAGGVMATGAGETPSHPARGIPEPPVIWATRPLVRLPAPVGGRAAQRTLSNRRDGVVRLGEAPPSHTWRGLVLLCPSRQNRARTDTPRCGAAIPGASFRRAAVNPSASVRRQAPRPATPRRPAEHPAGKPGTRATGRRAGPGRRGRRG
jgi:hypothetical protein